MAFFTRLILTLFGMAFAALLALGVLFWLILYAAFAFVRWLVTGQKPQVLMMWQQIQAMRKGMQTRQGARGFTWSGSSDEPWHAQPRRVQRLDHTTGAAEDVVVREVHAPRYLPKDG